MTSTNDARGGSGSDRVVNLGAVSAEVSSSIRSYHHGEFPTEVLRQAKGSQTVAVCLPARNEATTVGDIVSTIIEDLGEAGVVDEVIVIDDHSTDRTSAVARAAGAEVYQAEDILSGYGRGHGKGEVLWKSLLVAKSDVIVWCDSDIRDFDSRMVRGVLGPLLTDEEVWFSKGHYRRHENDGEGGGRVTELVARPLLSMFFPHLCPIIQPLSGEYGGRREMLEQVPFVEGYGVDVGLLIDLTAKFGSDGLAQVDLDERRHRNRPLSQLSPQATAVASTILNRAHPELVGKETLLLRPGTAPTLVDIEQRPPMVEVESYTARSA